MAVGPARAGVTRELFEIKPVVEDTVSTPRWAAMLEQARSYPLTAARQGLTEKDARRGGRPRARARRGGGRACASAARADARMPKSRR